ncbi:hypothetical protein BDV59DRAFT_186552 [Aspergillus ambiguus]|uniref:uncharacterized protein n=1 Tax=Aspergillus ambiguus TaxID=176160 RepID=UPI003CCE4509
MIRSTGPSGHLHSLHARLFLLRPGDRCAIGPYCVRQSLLHEPCMDGSIRYTIQLFLSNRQPARTPSDNIQSDPTSIIDRVLSPAFASPRRKIMNSSAVANAPSRPGGFSRGQPSKKQSPHSRELLALADRSSVRSAVTVVQNPSSLECMRS